MAYRFEAGETVEQAFRRCGTEQLDGAIHELTDGLQDDPVTAVHDARKALKKERSLLRLGRGSLSSSTRRSQNAALRDIGRKLSDRRDADVMVQALQGLSERYAGQLPKQAFTAIETHFSAKREDMNGNAGGIEEATNELKAARSAAAELKLSGEGWSAIAPGLRRSYRRGRKALSRADGERTMERMHDWRKRAKDLWYHLRLLEDISPHTLGGQAKDAHLLSDLLGDEHDLAVLQESLLGSAGQLPVDVDAVIGLIEHRRQQLQEEAIFLGSRVYAEKPKTFERRLHSYWKAWRAEAEALQERKPAEVAHTTRTSAAA